MTNTIEYTQANADRENMYNFLAFIYEKEVTEHTASLFKNIEITDEIDEEIAEGYKLMKNYFHQDIIDTITNLAVDYARVFLSAGVVEKNEAAFPYESVYTSPKRLIMQDARDEVLSEYRQQGLAVDTGFNVPEDHIALEFEYMAFLCNKSTSVANTDEMLSLIKKQKQFLSDHINKWVPEFCADVEKYASTDFYKGVAKITKAFLRMDNAIVDEMLVE